MRTSDDVRKEAKELLRSPYFFQHLLTALHEAGLVGERRNALVLYLTATSRFLPNPLNLFVKGHSSAGKNFLVRSVLQLFPTDSVFELTAATETALFNSAQGELAHKVVYLQERNESVGVTHRTRLLISEGRLIRSVSVRHGGRYVMEQQEVRGPVACISTTTEDRVSIDDETRHMSAWVDESEAQTLRVLATNPTGQIRLPRKGREVWHAVQRFVQERASLRFAYPRWRRELSQFVKADDVRVRRYYPAFMRAWETVGLIRSFLRPEAEFQGRRKLGLTFEDYGVAAIIFNKVFAESLRRASDACLQMRFRVKRLSGQKGGSPVDAGDVARALGIPTDRAYSLLRQAAAAGVIHRANRPTRSNRKLYWPAPEPRFVPSPNKAFAKLGLRGRARFVNPLTGEWVVCGGQPG